MSNKPSNRVWRDDADTVPCEAFRSPSLYFGLCEDEARIGIGAAIERTRIRRETAENVPMAPILTPEYTEVGRTIATEGDGFALIQEMLNHLLPFLDRSRDVVIDGFYDTESGAPAIMAKVRTSVADARDLLARIDEFQAGDWWWENRKSANFDLILSVGA